MVVVDDDSTSPSGRGHLGDRHPLLVRAGIDIIKDVGIGVRARYAPRNARARLHLGAVRIDAAAVKDGSVPAVNA